MRRFTWFCLAGPLAIVSFAFTASCGSDGDVTAAAGVTDAGADANAAVAVTCGAGQTCTSGRCTVTVPLAVASGNRNVTIAELPIRPELTADTTLSYACDLTLPSSPSVVPVRLSMETVGALPDSIFFRDEGAQAIAVPDSTSGPALIEALVNQSGTYGATVRSDGWRVSAAVPNDPLSSADLPSLLRNLSLQSTVAAAYDGVHLFVGNGPRVLVYDGIPTGPKVKPSLILGQASLDLIGNGSSSAVFGGSVNAIWSNGTKLVVAESNRVLVWNAVPTRSFEPADLVLGQADFVTATANGGGVSPSTMSSPRGIDSDGKRLVVADTLNQRVLVWSDFPTRVGQPATAVLGQPTFSNNDVHNLFQPWSAILSGDGAFVATAFTGVLHFPSLATNVPSDFAPVDPGGAARVQANGLVGSTSVSFLPNGGLAMTTTQAPRVCVQRAVPTKASSCDFTLGQADPNRATANPTSASSLGQSAKLVSNGGLTLVPDGSRLLLWEHVPAYNFDPADRVIGQAGFSVNEINSDYRNTSERTLAYPADVASNDASLAVADRGNNRVLLYPAVSGLADLGAPATVVLGQPAMNTFLANGEGTTPSAVTLSGPSGVALTATHLVVADSENHRVLVWTPVPTSSGAPASFVLGQADFAGHRPNHGQLDADHDGFSDASADGLFYPSGVVTDGKHLFVSDRLNHRVLAWDDLATLSNGKPADRVIGQPSFSSVGPNRGQGLFPSADSLHLPTALALAGTSLWIADTENNRAVRWDDATTNPVPGAVIGQTNLDSLSNPNSYPPGSPNVGSPVLPPTTAGSVLRPRGITVQSGTVYISERDSNRVHVFAPSGSGYRPVTQFGQPDATSAILNAGGVGSGTLASPEGLGGRDGRLFVADAANHRVVVVDPVALTASKLIGQSAFVANGMNQTAASSAGGTSRPRGMSISQGQLFLAERARHRVVVEQLPLVAGRDPVRILGHVDASVALPNDGVSPSAGSLSNPSAVLADDTHIYIADTGNSRIAVWPRTTGSAATLVLGQMSFDNGQVNRGGAVSAFTLNAPEGVYSDGSRVFVADTGNNRVLGWNALPTGSGQPADFVLGQPSFSTTAPNAGTGVPTAATLSGPTALIVVDGTLYVADTGNNRMLGYPLAGLTSGANASRIVGQPDASSRTPAADQRDGTRLAGPVALASDGTTIFVADRDGNRVVGFIATDIAAGAPAAILLNANSGLVATGPSGLAVERTPFFTSRLYVADTNKDQLLVLDGLSRLR